MRWLILTAFGLSGAAALIYEVAWTRALSIILGSTTYALSTMLSTFMAGLAIGAYGGGKLADRMKNLVLFFGLLELGIGIFGVITIPLIHSLPPLYFEVYRRFHLSPAIYFIFQFLLCSAIMLIPTTLMGATFPVVSRIVTDRMDMIGRRIGSAYSFNTFGAIIGSFMAGFILIPVIGVRAAAIVAAFMNIAVAFTMIVLSRTKLKGALVGIFIIIFGFVIAAALFSHEDKLAVSYYTAHRYQTYEDLRAANYGTTLLFDGEYREGNVKLVRDNMGFLSLRVGGKIEGTSPKDMINTLLLAYLPVASHPSPQSFLVIGLGAGVTLGAAKEIMEDVHLVEINEGVVDALKKFGPDGLLDGVTVTINDARNFLFLTRNTFDIISSEPSYPTEAASANLFTKEFYEIAAGKLGPGGIFCQWLPYYQLSNDDITMMLRTFGSVFDSVHLWKVESSLDLLMVGSKTPFQFSEEEIKEKTRALNATGRRLSFVLSRNSEQIREIVNNEKNIPINTDDKPLLEFHAARNLIAGVRD